MHLLRNNALAADYFVSIFLWFSCLLHFMYNVFFKSYLFSIIYLLEALRYNVKSFSSGVRLPGFKSWFYHLSDVWSWGNAQFPLSLSSLLCKTVITCTHFLGELQGLQKIIQIITCTSHLAHSRCSINLSFLNRAGEEVEITANIKKIGLLNYLHLFAI